MVGFVGWSALFRLIEPISAWLLPLRKNANLSKGIVRIVVCVFLIFANLNVLALVPMLLKSAAPNRQLESLVWKDAFGLAFMSSLMRFSFLECLIGSEGIAVANSGRS